MNGCMKRLEIPAPGQANWTDAPIPEPQAGEVLVRVEGVTTCSHWDMHLMSGEPMFPGKPLIYPYPPGQPGHEAAGEVVALGPGVSEPAIGSRVVAWRDQGHNRPGCYAQYTTFAVENILEIPHDLPIESIAPLEVLQSKSRCK